MLYFFFFILYESEYEDKFNDVPFNNLHTYIRSEMKEIVWILRINVLTSISYWDVYNSSYSIWFPFAKIHFCILCNTLLVASAICTCGIDAQIFVIFHFKLFILEDDVHSVYDMIIAIVKKKLFTLEIN